MTAFTLIVIIAAALLQIIDVIQEFQETDKGFWAYLIIVFKIIVAIALCFIAGEELLSKKEKDQRDQGYGEIAPNKKIKGITYPIIRFGGTSFENTGSTVAVGEETQLSAKVVNEKLVLEVKIKDSRNNVIVHINEEGWQPYSSDIDFNNDNTAFEVVRADKRVIFQIELKNDTVFCQGILFGGGGYVSGDADHFSVGVIPNHTEKIWLPPNLRIPRIFKYPRNKHYQKRETIR